MLGNSGTALATLTNPDSRGVDLSDVRLAIIQFDDVVDA